MTAPAHERAPARTPAWWVFWASLVSVGYAYVGLEPQSWKELRDACGYVHDIVVDAGGRRHGAGTALMEAAFAWLRQRKAPRVVLWTSPHNENAQRLFDRLGFRRTMIEMTRELEDGQ